MKIDLNSDLGEAFGAHTVGLDDEIFDLITSANVACGWHGGDPRVMERTVGICQRKGIAVGAHPGFADLVEPNGFVLVVPDGANQRDGSQVFPVDWNILASQYDTDNQDLVFFDDLLKCVSEQYTIDPDRVYVTGMSGGGLMTTFLGLHRAEVVAAAAPMSGGYLQAWQSLIAPAAPWMVTWGGADDFAVDVDFNDAANDLIGNLEADGAFVVACDHGGGHVWPREMTAAAWAFLSSFTRGDAQNPLATGDLPDAFPDYCARRD